MKVQYRYKVKGKEIVNTGIVINKFNKFLTVRMSDGSLLKRLESSFKYI